MRCLCRSKSDWLQPSLSIFLLLSSLPHLHAVENSCRADLPTLPPAAGAATYGPESSCGFDGTVIIGGPPTLSRDTAYAIYGRYIRQALMLFADHINDERGGLQVGSQRYAVRFKWVDDASSTAQVANATAHALRRAPSADFAIAGYSSSLTALAARQSFDEDKLIVGTAADPTVYTQNSLSIPDFVRM